MSRTDAILVTLIAYQVVLLAIGWVAQRRTHDEADYFLGGRRLGPWVAAISASASSSSAWTLLGVSGAAYTWGLGALWLFPSCVGGFLLNWYVLAPPLRRLARQSGAITVSDLLAGERGAAWHLTIRRVAGSIVLVSLGAYVAAQFSASGKTFAETFDLDSTTSVLIGAGVVLIYTLVGGFWAVSLTDTLQGALMAATAVVLPLGALIEVGGFGQLASGIGGVPIEGFASLTRNLPPVAACGFVLGLLGIGLGYPGQPHVVNRFMALENQEAERPARRIAIVWAVLVYAGMILLGICGRVLFAKIADGETIFIRVTNEIFPAVVAGVMVAAVLSAIMSTADSQLLVAASAVSHDMIAEGQASGRAMLRSRLTVLVLSVAAITAALLVDETIFDQVLFAWTAMGAAFGPLLLVTVLRGPVPPGRTLGAMLAGFGLSVLAYYLGKAGAVGAAIDPVLQRIVPFLAAFLIILVPGRPGPESS